MKPIVLWEDLNIKDKVKLFGYWSLVSIIANVLQLFGSLSNIMSVYSTSDIQETGNGVELLIGLGCLSAWVGLVRYMETSRNYSILAHTLSRAIPNVLKTLISALPVFLGFAFLGLAVFWQSNRFSSTSGTLMTLYSLMFGDMVYDTFHDLA